MARAAFSHLSLGGVYVDVEVVAGHGYPQVHEGVRALGEDVSVGRLDGLFDRGALHQAVVDEEDEVGPLSCVCTQDKMKKERRGGNNKGVKGRYYMCTQGKRKRESRGEHSKGGQDRYLRYTQPEAREGWKYKGQDRCVPSAKEEGDG